MLAVFVGCVPDEQLPATCSQASVSFEATVSPEGMKPQTIDVCQNQDVHVTVRSQASGVFHFHGYDDQVPARTIAPGETLQVDFKAVRAGQFPIELHPLDGSEATSLGVVIVHPR